MAFSILLPLLWAIQTYISLRWSKIQAIRVKLVLGALFHNPWAVESVQDADKYASVLCVCHTTAVIALSR